MKVLIAEDDAVSRLILQRTLEKAGHTCLVAREGREAWGMFEAEEVDIVISDWLMPGMSGVELCRNIRAHPERPTVYTYVIFLSALKDREHQRAMLQVGADDYLTKPLDAMELDLRLAIAARVIGLHGRVAQLQAELTMLRTELAPLSPDDSEQDGDGRESPFAPRDLAQLTDGM